MSSPASDHQLAGFDLRSVAVFATRFYACAIAIFMSGALVLWVLGSVMGFVAAFEKFTRGVGFAGFHLLALEPIVGLLLIAVVCGAFMVGVTVVAAALYNVLAAKHGGVGVSVTGPIDPSMNGGSSHGKSRHGIKRSPMLRPTLRSRVAAVRPHGNGARDLN